MKSSIFTIFLSFAAAVQCADFSLLRDLSTLDFNQVINNIFSTNLDDFDFVSQNRVTDDGETLRNREYDWEKCVAELGDIADGLNRTEMWAIQSEYLRSQLYKEVKTQLYNSEF